jgi:hypothetical protein
MNLVAHQLTAKNEKDDGRYYRPNLIILKEVELLQIS